ncbi:toll-like receptor 4 [Haliotis rufescens]|uniref:toll-like receptor 4 n=1 Tax=Haliotis rufescens TaxID=6454 RepID=UPI001EAF9891|nr:toll-like receptor 4 [Haliotis rufescens]
MTLCIGLVLPLWLTVVLMSTDGSSLDCQPCRCSETKGEIIAYCTNRSLSSVPNNLPYNVTDLRLSHNRMSNTGKYLKKYTFLKRLDLSFNKLYTLGRNAFVGLTELEVLILSHNHLSLSKSVYPVRMFRFQKKLRVLKMESNSPVEYEGHLNNSLAEIYLLQYPDEIFKDLVSLEELHIDGLRNPVFGEGFKYTNITRLVIGGNCDMRHVSNVTFRYLRGITHLDVTSCEVTDIGQSAFEPFQNIHTLDLSNNPNLGLDKACASLYGLRNSSLKILKANKIVRYQGTGILVSVEHVKYMTDMVLEGLHLDDNRIELLDPRVPVLMPKTLKTVSFRRNMFLFGIYLLTMTSMTNLQFVDSSSGHWSHARPFSVQAKAQLASILTNPHMDYADISRHDESGSTVCSVANSNKHDFSQFGDISVDDIPWPGNFTINIPPNATHGNASNSKLSYIIPRITFGKNRLKVLDLSYNFFTQWSGPIIGLHHLEFIDGSHNYCELISIHFFDDFLSLRILNISYNYLGYSLQNETFRKLSNLEHLDLSNNKLNTLPRDIFKGLEYLTYLSVRSNYLNTWNANIGDLRNLKLLDLSENLFEQLDVTFRNQIDDNTSKGLLIVLQRNRWRCTCETLSFLKWLNIKGSSVYDMEELSCTEVDGGEKDMANLPEIIMELEKNCASYTGVVIGMVSLIMLVLALTVTGVVYRYRWKLRYLYYVARNRHRGYLPAVEAEQEFEFDAFISYADEDRGLVVRDMRQKLEEIQGLKLCIHHRDFLVGEAIAANILNAVKSSRKTVIILSRHFLRSYWCKYEVEMAKMESIYTGRNALLVVVLENIPVKDLTPDIVELMRQDSYVEYTDDQDGQEVFWQNLERAIRTM